MASTLPQLKINRTEIRVLELETRRAVKDNSVKVSRLCII